MITTVSQIIEKALVEARMTKTQLAAALGMSPQNLYKRLKTGKFSYQELQAIAEAMGAKLELSFVIGN